ncbi:MAG TPA: MFS transporter [Jatrophihabitans sp.]|nr:MFS transporter [Jatrophihabitans sp.]
MLSRYRAAFAPPGALAFSAAGFVARFALAIYPIGLVLIVSARTHAYGYAGVVSGAYVLGSAVGGPTAGLLVDRFGQHAMLLRYAALHLAMAACFAALIEVRAPLWTLLPPAALMGASFLNVGALIRARWSHVWADQPAPRATAYSVESAVDELVFVLGPLVATLLATHLPAVVTLAVAVAVIVFGSLWLAGQRRTEPPVRARGHGERHEFALRSRGMLLITWVMVFMGAVFGSAEVVMVAFCGQHGQRASSGWVVACFALGSMVAGIGYGARHWQAPLLHRFVGSALAFGVLPLLYLLAGSVTQLAVCTFFVGLGIAPTLIGGFGLVDAIVPARSLTEGLTWIGTGLSVGYGAGAALVGGIADRHGAHLAFLVPICCSLLAASCAVALGARMRVPVPAEARLGSPAAR